MLICLIERDTEKQNKMETQTNKQEITLNKNEILKVYFEGHTFYIYHDLKTNENLKIERII